MRKIAILMLWATTALAADSLEPAREAFVKSEFKKAIELAKPEVAKDPEGAWKLIGASHCFLKDRDQAHAAYDVLSEHGRSFVKYVCSRNGITLP